MEEFGKIVLGTCIFGISLVVAVFFIRGCQAPDFITINNETVMKHDQVFYQKLPTGYYRLVPIEVEQVIK